MFSKLEWQLTAGPAWIAKQARDDMDLMMELPSHQGLHGQKPHAQIPTGYFPQIPLHSSFHL